MATLQVGPKFYSEGASNSLKVFEGESVRLKVDGLEALYDPSSQLLRRYASVIETVEIGFCDIQDTRFLQYLPNVNQVWILSSDVKDISGLRFTQRLRRLAIERPTCRMDVLGDLQELVDLSLDDWRPGAASIFRLKKLESLQIRRFPYANLVQLSHFQRLRTLWLTQGSIESLDGIPSGVVELELCCLRKLHDIRAVGQCENLVRLIAEACTRLSSLSGLERCSVLNMLSVFNCKTTLESLEPIRSLSRLTYLVLTDFTALAHPDETALDNLQRLERLIISKKIGIPLARLQQALPHTDIRYVR